MEEIVQMDSYLSLSYFASFASVPNAGWSFLWRRFCPSRKARVNLPFNRDAVKQILVWLRAIHLRTGCELRYGGDVEDEKKEMMARKVSEQFGGMGGFRDLSRFGHGTFVLQSHPYLARPKNNQPLIEKIHLWKAWLVKIQVILGDVAAKSIPTSH